MCEDRAIVVFIKCGNIIHLPKKTGNLIIISIIGIKGGGCITADCCAICRGKVCFRFFINLYKSAVSSSTLATGLCGIANFYKIIACFGKSMCWLCFCRSSAITKVPLVFANLVAFGTGEFHDHSFTPRHLVGSC